MQCVTKPRITELNPHLLCVLCGGYYIDATAIVECLHSFCKSCIVRYLETHKYCPICDVLVHKTKPLQNLRPDTILQNIVYKLVPNLYEREMLNRRQYYTKVHPGQHPDSLEEKGEISESSNFYSSSDTISFSLEYSDCLENKNDKLVASASKRYFRCQTPVTVEVLRKLVAAKYGLVRDYEVRFFYNEIQLPEHLTLLDIAYISSWKRRDIIRILYQILEVRKLVVKVETQTPSAVTIPPLIPLPDIPKANSVNNTGPCMVTPMEENDISESTKPEVPEKANMPISSHNETMHNIVETGSSKISVSSNAPHIASDSTPSVTVTSSISTAEVTVFTASAPITTPACVAKVNGISTDTEVPPVIQIESKINEENDESISCTNETSEKNNVVKSMNIKGEQEILPKSPPVAVKRKIDSVDGDEKKIMNYSSTIDTNIKESAKSSPVPSKIPKLLAVKPVEIVQDEEMKKPVPVTNHLPLKPVPNMVKLVTTSALLSASPLSITVTSACLSAAGSRNTFKTSTNVSTTMNLDTVQKSAPRPIFTRSELPTITKSKPPIMKTFTRPWSTPNPTSTPPVATSPPKDKVKPMKIIEARNTPRFLGNPASGIRPLFQVAPPSMAVSNQIVKKEDVKRPVKKVSVTRIDPKTLSPIAASSPSSSGNTPIPSSVISKNSFPYSRPAAELYARSATFTSPNLSALTTSSSLAAKSQSSFLLQNLQYNPMYPMNQLMFEMYDGALGCMKAMTSNFCHPSLFHPMHANLNALYGPLHKNTKLEKSPHLSLTSKTPPPTVQRIPPSNNNTKLLSLEEHSNDSKKVAASGKHDSVSNGQLKNKTKKSPEVSNFSINNLIPLEAVKPEHVTHSCSADGVNQICDQMSPGKKKSHADEKNVKEAESKVNKMKD